MADFGAQAGARIVHSGPVFAVERRTLRVRTGDGESDLVRDIVRHPGAVAVVPVLDDGRLVLIRNHRVSIDDWLWELCAGKLEPGEDPACAARRELEEETGWSAATIRPMGSFLTSPGFADEVMHLFEASGLRPVPRRLEPGERIEVHALEPAAIEALIDAGEIRDGKTLVGLLRWLRRRPA